MATILLNNDKQDQPETPYTRLYVNECLDVKEALLRFVCETGNGKRQDPAAVAALPGVAKILLDYYG